MVSTKADIISQLKKSILSLQGFKPLKNGCITDMGLGPVAEAFPNASFPLGAVHEFCCSGSGGSAASGGFIAGLMSTLMKDGAVSLWISSSRTLFPPALVSFGIDPGKIIFIDLQKEKDILWAMEEALKCNGLAAVVGEMKHLSFTASRRLQLAVEQSRVTGFILRPDQYALNTTACVTRWKITPLPGEPEDGLPGVGYPRWNVELLKVRNGRPGNWQVEWVNERFRPVYRLNSQIQQQKKTG